MKKNMSTADRTIRLIVAVVLVALAFTHAVTGAVAVIFTIIAGVFFLTSLISFCPLYRLFGLSTYKRPIA